MPRAGAPGDGSDQAGRPTHAQPRLVAWAAGRRATGAASEPPARRAEVWHRPSSGAWMRLTGLAAAGATLLAVISGATGFEHRELAALALPPLVALVVAGWFARRRLLVPSLVAVILFGAAALVTADAVHVALAALAFAAALIACAQTFRGEYV